MKIKKIAIIVLVSILFVTFFLSIDTFFPQKSEAIGFPEAAAMVAICCYAYSLTCPVEVRELCFSDCQDANCGLW